MKPHLIATLFFAITLFSGSSLVAQSDFIRGDCNGDGFVTIADAVFAAIFRFHGAPEPDCRTACDFNNTNNITLVDVLYPLNFFYIPGSPPLPGPYPD